MPKNENAETPVAPGDADSITETPETETAAKPAFVEGVTAKDVKAEADLIVKGLKAVVAVAGKMTQGLKATAKEIVKLRGMYMYNGGPDWGAKSQAYKDAANAMYTVAGINIDQEKYDDETNERNKDIQAKLRYHISNALREVVPEADLIEAGLDPRSAKERQAARQGNNGKADSGVPVGGRVQVPGVKVSESVGSLAVAVTRALAETDTAGAVAQAVSIVETAHSFGSGIPETEEGRTALVLALNKLMALAQSWSMQVSLAPAVGGAEVEPEPGSAGTEATEEQGGESSEKVATAA